ncbi:MAG: hypothetical protein ACK41P_00965 [Asticcacaulis sp.]
MSSKSSPSESSAADHIRDATENLRADLKSDFDSLSADVARLAKAMGEMGIDKANAAAVNLDEAGEAIKAGASSSLQAFEKVIREHPATSFGVALGVGALLGAVLFSRR